MLGTDPDAPTEPLTEYPEEVEGARLVGVDSTGVPIYFDESERRAFEVVQRSDAFRPGEERGDGGLASVVDEVETITGWEALSEFAAQALSEEEQ